MKKDAKPNGRKNDLVEAMKCSRERDDCEEKINKLVWTLQDQSVFDECVKQVKDGRRES